MKQTYNTALYMRLSRDDENYGDSVSIETQRTILRQFAKENLLHVVDEYVEETMSLDDMEKKAILLALERNKGKRRNAAKELNISERTLYRKIKEYGIE